MYKGGRRGWVTDDAALARKIYQLKGQGQDPEQRYWFPVLSYNYRMTNIQAALGLAQLEEVDWHLCRRREIAGSYQELLGGHPLLALQPKKPWARNVYWMNSAVLAEGFPLDRDETMRRLAEDGIETRPFFYPMHTLPMYRSPAGGGAFPVAESLSARGMNLPSSAGLAREDVAYVAERLVDLGNAKA